MVDVRHRVCRQPKAHTSDIYARCVRQKMRDNTHTTSDVTFKISIPESLVIPGDSAQTDAHNGRLAGAMSAGFAPHLLGGFSLDARLLVS